MSHDSYEVADVDRNGWTHTVDGHGNHRYSRTDNHHYIEAIMFGDDWVIQLRGRFDDAPQFDGPIEEPVIADIGEGYAAVQKFMDRSESLVDRLEDEQSEAA